MYNKLFTKILDSSVWLEPDTVRLVWITFIACMDEDGFVALSTVGNVSQRARVSLPAAKRAIECLEGPDKHAPDQEFEGRRIERVPNGWLVLNADKYRNMVTRIASREATRLRVAKHRANKKSAGNGSVTHGNEKVTASVSEAVSTASDSERKNALLQNLPDLSRHTPAQRERIARTKT